MRKPEKNEKSQTKSKSNFLNLEILKTFIFILIVNEKNQTYIGSMIPILVHSPVSPSILYPMMARPKWWAWTLNANG